MVESIIFHVILALVMVILARIAPARTASKAFPALDDPTLQRLYNRATWVTVLLIFIWTPFGAWALGNAFFALAQWNRTHFANTPYQIVASLTAWCCVAAVFVLAWTKEVLTFFISRESMEAVNIMTQRQYGYDDTFLWRGLKRFLMAIGIIAFVYTSDYGVFVFDKHVEYNKFLSLFQQQTIPFESINAIEYERDLWKEKALVPPDPVYVIRFKDGDSWRSNFNDFKMVTPVMEVLVRNTGMSVDTVFVSDH